MSFQIGVALGGSKIAGALSLGRSEDCLPRLGKK